MHGRVLIIAGSDSGGGAGIQADIKTVTALEGYAATAITALTAQNTEGVHGIFDVDADFVARQMDVVLSDIGVDCIKIGMLHRPDIIETVATILSRECPDVPVVLDPVMVAKGGASLIENAALNALQDKLLPLATVLTPNIPEAEILAGETISSAQDALHAGETLVGKGVNAVLMKGGHLEGPKVIDQLIQKNGERLRLEAERIDTPHTHGTGCTLASAIATGVAQGLSVTDSVTRAHAYVQEAIATAPGLGKGHGPLNHSHTVSPFSGS